MEDLKKLSNEDLAEYIHELLMNAEDSSEETNPDYIRVCGVYHQITDVQVLAQLTVETTFMIYTQEVPSIHEHEFPASREFVEELASKLDAFFQKKPFEED